MLSLAGIGVVSGGSYVIVDSLGSFSSRTINLEQSPGGDSTTDAKLSSVVVSQAETLDSGHAELSDAEEDEDLDDSEAKREFKGRLSLVSREDPDGWGTVYELQFVHDGGAWTFESKERTSVNVIFKGLEKEVSNYLFSFNSSVSTNTNDIDEVFKELEKTSRQFNKIFGEGAKSKLEEQIRALNL
nr:hypothetical protein [Candidatus Mycoplasma haematolamae]